MIVTENIPPSIAHTRNATQRTRCNPRMSDTIATRSIHLGDDFSFILNEDIHSLICHCSALRIYNR
jgi:hypothetical protein